MKKKYIILSIVVIILAVSAYFIFAKSSDSDIKFSYATITKGDLNNIITSTGTLQADTTIEVGTQVSGIIAKIFVDYNNRVKRGQLLAVLDTTLLSAQVGDAKSNLSKAQAEYDQAVAKDQRNQVLYKKGFLSELDYIASKTDLESAQADLNSAQSALQRSKTNLAYAFITSPISGKVIARNVEQGQTVAASFSTPTLFTIADDMSHMQIQAAVDESDIGQVKTGQKVNFTVEAYPSKKFNGVVQQVRLDPQTVQNVVNYTVIIDADNSEGLLLPGMTATIDFYIQQLHDVLLVPNAALRYQPSQELMTEFMDEMKAQANNLPDSVKNRFRNRSGNGGGGGFAFGGGNGGGGGGFAAGGGNGQMRNTNFGRVWYQDSNGKLKMAGVVLGMTDGKSTQVLRSRDLKDGMKVITSATGGDDNQTSNNNNNFRGMRRVF
jgi:HlyD family secretion protein